MLLDVKFRVAKGCFKKIGFDGTSKPRTAEKIFTSPPEKWKLLFHMLTLKFREYFIGFFNLEISFHTQMHLKFLIFKAVSIMVIETAENKL